MVPVVLAKVFKVGVSRATREVQSNDFGSVRLLKFKYGRHNEKWKCGDLLALGAGSTSGAVPTNLCLQCCNLPNFQ